MDWGRSRSRWAGSCCCYWWSRDPTSDWYVGLLRSVKTQFSAVDLRRWEWCCHLRYIAWYDCRKVCMHVTNTPHTALTSHRSHLNYLLLQTREKLVYIVYAYVVSLRFSEPCSQYFNAGICNPMLAASWDRVTLPGLYTCRVNSLRIVNFVEPIGKPN